LAGFGGKRLARCRIKWGKTQKQNSIQLFRPTETLGLAFLQSLDAEFEEVPNAVLMRVITGQGDQGNISSGMQIHVAPEKGSQNFLTISSTTPGTEASRASARKRSRVFSSARCMPRELPVLCSRC